MTPIIFLHVPKTAGQTIHNQLAGIVGHEAVSPVRVRNQAVNKLQMPPGYLLYSGHIDWTEADQMAEKFMFTVLRNPAERIASFYFFLLDEAESMSEEELAKPANHGKKRIRTLTAEDYLFAGNRQEQRFICSLYDNFYCSYFATRKMDGWSEVSTMTQAEKIKAAFNGLASLDRIYETSALQALEQDIAERFGHTIKVAGNYYNTGRHSRSETRWTKLLNRLGTDASRRRIEDYVADDCILMDMVKFAEPKA
ncbi:MAG: sulfotransferase family 2 domain-containing protein [Paracoccaceae bacterium]